MTTLRSKLSAAFASSAFLSLIRIGGAGAGFLAQLTMAWTLTPAHLGIFYSATSLIAVAAIVTAQGYPQIAVRFLSRYQGPERSWLLKSFVGRAFSDSMRLAIVLAVIIAGVATLYPGIEMEERLTFAVCAAMLPMATLLNVFTNLAGAKKHFGICYVPEGLFRPAVFFLVMASVGLAGWHFTASQAAIIITVITFAVSVYVYVAVNGLLPDWRVQPLHADGLARRWRREAWPLILLSLFTNFFVDVAILCASPFLANADIAVFGFCMKLAMLVGYVVQITQQMSVPDLAEARRHPEPRRIERIMRRAIVMPTIVTGIATVGVYFFGGQLLGLLGESFTVGHSALVVLVASQFLRALAGPSVHLITLIGAQYVNASLSAVAVAILMATYWLLTPAFGLLGAACAVLIAYVCWLIAMAIALRFLGEFQTDAVSLLWRRTVASPTPALTIAAR
jgi:O-antigen/teichoic acid export membrane protein